MKKRYRIILIVLTCLLIAAIVLYSAERQYGLLSRIYWGDRITVILDASVDGEPIHPDSAEVVCDGVDGRQEVHHNDSDKYSVRANEYGEYTFTFSVKQQIIQLKLIHTNWWEINSCKLSFDINSNNSQISYTITDASGEETSDTERISGNTFSLSYMFS